MAFIVDLILACLSLLAISLQRTYARTPAKELRRRARSGDELAAALYKAVAYGHSLRTVLWLFIGLTSALFFIFASRTAPLWFALASCGALIWIGFVWLPASRVTIVGEQLARLAAPVLSRLLYYVHPFVDRTVLFIRGLRPIHFHTGLYERADLLDLLDRQQVQADNRMEQAELDIARNALTFSDKRIGDIMTPRRVVRMVSGDDSMGPVLMNELHASGHSRFPVYSGKEDSIIGTLFLRDLVGAKEHGKVKDVMRPKAMYLHEQQSAHEALQAILKTRHHLYVVVNSFEEYVGIVTIEDILEQILGEQVVDEFDHYEDMRAVAATAAKKDHQQHTQPQKSTEDPTEVIE